MIRRSLNAFAVAAALAAAACQGGEISGAAPRAAAESRNASARGEHAGTASRGEARHGEHAGEAGDEAQAAGAERGGGVPGREGHADEAPPREAVHEEHGAHSSAAAPARHEDGDGHGHGAGEASDLDRPVDDLFAASCEHGTRAHECDECRHEVGVVRVPAKLLESGLLRKASVSRRSVEVPLQLTGEVRFDERRVAHVSAPLEGTVLRVHASLGERVRRGQPLLELESIPLGEAEGEYLAAQAALRLARSSFERQEQLRREQISSEKEYLAARQEHEAAEIRARSAQERLARLGVSPRDVERLAGAGRSPGRGALVVRAPADGIVLEMHAVPGELARPGESIVTVGDLSAVWVWADLHEDQLGRVLDAQRGSRLRAEIAVRAFPDASFPGGVDFVGPAMDERTRTAKVRVAVPNPEGRLRAGMFATVRVFVPGRDEALAVPRSAVLTDEGRSFVFVHHRGDYWVRRPVEAGRRWLDWVEVKGGLGGGETVAADGSFLLKSDVLRSKMGAGCAD